MRFIALFCIGVWLLGMRATQAEDLYASPGVSGSNNGSSSKPFVSLKKALSHISPGDTLWLGEGRYEEPLKLVQKKSIKILPMEGAAVVIDGTVEIPKAWIPDGNGVWKQTLDFEPYQLFHDDRLVYVARWPDAKFEDGSIWRMMECMRSADGGWDKHKNKWAGKTRFGLLYDDRFHRPETPGFREGDSRYQVDPDIGFRKSARAVGRIWQRFYRLCCSAEHWALADMGTSNHRPQRRTRSFLVRHHRLAQGTG